MEEFNPTSHSNLQLETDELLDNLKCPLCLDFFNDPVMELPNQHIFCNGCLKRYFKSSSSINIENSNKCPICKEEIKELINARLVVNMLSHIKIKCQSENKLKPNLDECEWQGDINQYWVHIKTCPVIINQIKEKLIQIVQKMIEILDKEINPHLKSVHSQIFDHYVQNWEWLNYSKNDWKWWWWAKNEWWDAPCEECNSVWHVYDKEIQSLEIQRIDILNQLESAEI